MSAQIRSAHAGESGWSAKRHIPDVGFLCQSRLVSVTTSTSDMLKQRFENGISIHSSVHSFIYAFTHHLNGLHSSSVRGSVNLVQFWYGLHSATFVWKSVCAWHRRPSNRQKIVRYRTGYWTVICKLWHLSICDAFANWLIVSQRQNKATFFFF